MNNHSPDPREVVARAMFDARYAPLGWGRGALDIQWREEADDFRNDADAAIRALAETCGWVTPSDCVAYRERADRAEAELAKCDDELEFINHTHALEADERITADALIAAGSRLVSENKRLRTALDAARGVLARSTKLCDDALADDVIDDYWRWYFTTLRSILKEIAHPSAPPQTTQGDET